MSFVSKIKMPLAHRLMFILAINATVLSLSRAFNSEHEPIRQNDGSPRHHQEGATTATATTTTGPNSNLLHEQVPPESFEVNKEDVSLEPLLQQSSLTSASLQSTNGSAILEDLVNQFVEKNREAFRRSASEHQQHQEPIQSDEATLQVEVEQQNDKLVGAAETTPLPFMNLVELTTLDAIQSENELAASIRPTINDSLVQQPDQWDLKDRHIQYDMIPTRQPPVDRGGGHDDWTTGGQQQQPQFSGPQLSGQFQNLVVANSTTQSTNYSLNVIRTSDTNDIKSEPLASEQQWQQVAAGLRSSGVQARSMSSTTSRLPQHSKPPYASYNQFHQRTDVGAGLGQHQLEQNGSTTTWSQARPAAAAANNQAAAARQEAASQQGNGLQQDTTNGQTSSLINSISRISSQLASEAAASKASEHEQTGGSGLARAPAPDDASIRDQEDELERAVQKLAPVNELVVLNPIPARDGGQPARDSGQPPPDRDNATRERYYLAPGLEGGGQPAAGAPFSWTTSGQMERYADAGLQHRAPGAITGANDSLGEQQQADSRHQEAALVGPRVEAPIVQPLAKKAHDTRSGAPGSRYQQQQPVLVGALQQLNRKTLELVHDQLHADQSNGGASGGGHRERQPNPIGQLALGRAPATLAETRHYAASLINITAPIVSPLSATEAMEAALAGADSTRQLLLHKPGAGNTIADHGTAARPPGGGGPARTNFNNNYFVTDHHQLVSSHSQPANQFLVRPAAPTSPFETPMGPLLAANELSASLSAAERERMRLEAAVAGSAGHYSFVSSRSPAPGANGGGPMHLQQASGFRLPALHTSQHQVGPVQPLTTSMPLPSSYLNNNVGAGAAGAPPGPLGAANGAPVSAASQQQQQSLAANTSAPMAAASTRPDQQQPAAGSLSTNSNGANNKNGTTTTSHHHHHHQANSSPTTPTTATTNGFITSSVTNATGGPVPTDLTTANNNSNNNNSGNPMLSTQSGAAGSQINTFNRRVSNLTRVEHISAECSNDLIRTVIIFNGTFKGIIYSSGYVRDSNCLYINGTGKTRYDFSIRLNQCGTLGRQEIHPPSGPNEVRRRDQVMWNTLSIQYNPIIEQEWDEHFRVSCEYGSDFWKTVSFSPFNVETNTGSPVVFTVDPPQCQMEILRGHGMVGPRQETISGPVTVGDPLTLLIHMKSEKAGYDILVKNCIAHNGGQQKMQLIDSNGCVVNERFISPFRGTYNDNDLKHVTLYSYLKAFRFTGSPVLYLECEVHMCQSSCPPQMCYWRRLSKRSAGSNNNTHLDQPDYYYGEQSDQFDLSNDGSPSDLTPTASTTTTTMSTTSTTTSEPTRAPEQSGGKRRSRKIKSDDTSDKLRSNKKTDTGRGRRGADVVLDKVSLFQALEVRQEREPDNAALYSPAPGSLVGGDQLDPYLTTETTTNDYSLMCYRRAEVFAFLFLVASILLATISVTIGCCLRASSVRSRARKKLASVLSPPASANICHSPVSSISSASNRSEGVIACGSPGASSSNNINYVPLGSLGAMVGQHHHFAGIKKYKQKDRQPMSR